MNFQSHIRTALLLAPLAAPAVAGDHIRAQPAADRFPLVHPPAAADIFMADDDWKVGRIVAGDFALDIERVTGRKPVLKHATAGLSGNAVLVGTLGKSPVIDCLVKEGRLDVREVQGRGESFLIGKPTAARRQNPATRCVSILKSMATSAAAPASRKCCCKAMSQWRTEGRSRYF